MNKGVVLSLVALAGLAGCVASVPIRLYTVSAGGPGLSAAWDTIYGPGFHVQHMLGSQYFSRAVLTGNHGTVLNVELNNEKDERGNTKGVAQDNHGNLFKLVVQN
jgi:hypothetical protein